MADQYESLVKRETLTTESNPLFAGSTMPYVQKTITIAMGQPAFTAGQVLKVVSGKHVRYDGTGTAVGYLGQDTPAASTGDILSFMYVTGEPNESRLTGLDAAARAAFESLNIYPKKVST